MLETRYVLVLSAFMFPCLEHFFLHCKVMAVINFLLV